MSCANRMLSSAHSQRRKTCTDRNKRQLPVVLSKPYPHTFTAPLHCSRLAPSMLYCQRRWITLPSAQHRSWLTYAHPQRVLCGWTLAEVRQHCSISFLDSSRADRLAVTSTLLFKVAVLSCTGATRGCEECLCGDAQESTRQDPLPFIPTGEIIVPQSLAVCCARHCI